MVTVRLSAAFVPRKSDDPGSLSAFAWMHGPATSLATLIIAPSAGTGSGIVASSVVPVDPPETTMAALV